MDALLKLLAVLTLIWGGWMYFKNADYDTELKKIHNELKVAEQEFSDAQAAYDAEVKKREALSGEVNALKENNKELRKEIALKAKEERERAIQERRERLEAERKAQAEESEKERQHRIALLDREKQFEKEEKEQDEASRKEEEAQMAAERSEQEKEWKDKRLQEMIEGSERAMGLHLSSSAYVPRDVNDYGQIEKLKYNWTRYVQACIDAAKKGDSKRFEKFGRMLLNVAHSLNRVSKGQNTHCINDATDFLSEGRKILKAKKQLSKDNP